MSLTVEQLTELDNRDLATWMKPTPVDPARGDMMLAAAVASVRQAVFPRTELPDTAKYVVLESAARGYRPRVQQESLGSRSVSYFQPTDPRGGVFLTAEELAQLGVESVSSLGVGVAWARSTIRSRYGMTP